MPKQFESKRYVKDLESVQNSAGPDFRLSEKQKPTVIVNWTVGFRETVLDITFGAPRIFTAREEPTAESPIAKAILLSVSTSSQITSHAFNVGRYPS
jgi:hypothetical protein